MNKKLYLLIPFILCVLLSWAKDVNEAYAKQVAQNYYRYNTKTDKELTLAYTCTTNHNVGRSSDARPVYYVFNTIDNTGFIIVSGEDLVQPVLGYSTEGAFTPDNLPDAPRKWMDNYKQQIVYVKENIKETTSEITRQWNDYYNNQFAITGQRDINAVNPLCATKWNQSPYENAFSPFDNQYNEKCVTGCVATAMAQIMKFWNYPTQGTGFHSYNEQTYGTLSANFGSTTYEWGSMPNTLTSVNNAVSTLMLHCGVAVEMDYGPGQTGGSAAYVVNAASPIQHCSEYAYKTYFGYDPTLQGLLRANYSDGNWIGLLKAELDASRPLQYAGIGNGGGHTWVCDGYDNNNNFHMNWGWAGNSDGYFSLNNLDPSALGAGGGTGGFNNNQQAVVGIKPLTGNGGGGGGGGTVNPGGIQLFSATTVSANPFQSGNSFEVYAQIANTGNSTFTGTIAAGLFNNDGVFIDFIQEYTNQSLNSGFFYDFTFSTSQLNLIPGIYWIGLFYKTGSNNYSLIDNMSFFNPVSITVTGPYSDLQMYSGSSVTPTNVIRNQAMSVSTQIANFSASTFNGYIAAALYDEQGNYVQTIQQGTATINGGFYNDFTFSSTGLNVSPGTYYIAYSYSYNGQDYGLVYTQDANKPNPIKIIISDTPLNPDMYENNNTSGGAYALTTNFSGNNANISTPGSNAHVGNDYDYYKINLPSGTNYTINARVHDSYSSGNGQNYTNDMQFSYVVNGGNLSDPYDDVLPGAIYVQNGGTVIFYVSNYFTGSTGTYLLDLQVTRGVVGIKENELLKLLVFPNPTNNTVFVDAGEMTGEYTLAIFDQTGRIVHENKGMLGQQLINTDVSGLAAGLYTVKLQTADNTATTKLIIE